MRTLPFARPRTVDRVRRRQARHVREDDGRGDRQPCSDPQQASIDRDIERADGEARCEPRDHGDERPRHRDPEQCAGATEDEALGEQRPPQRAAARAERGTDRQLGFAAHGARQNQIGDIRTRNDEDDAGSGEQHEEDWARRSGDLVAQRRQAQSNVGLRRVGASMLLHHGAVSRDQFGACRVQRRARRKPPEQLRHSMRSLGHHRCPQMVRATDDVGDDLGVGGIRN